MKKKTRKKYGKFENSGNSFGIFFEFSFNFQENLKNPGFLIFDFFLNFVLFCFKN